MASAVNAPVQGTADDAMKLAFALLWERRECPGAVPILTVHNEIVVEGGEEHAEKAKAWLVGTMKDSMDAVVNAENGIATITTPTTSKSAAAASPTPPLLSTQRSVRRYAMCASRSVNSCLCVSPTSCTRWSRSASRGCPTPPTLRPALQV